MAGQRKTYAWYVRQGLTPPSHLKPKIKGYKHNKYRDSSNVVEFHPTQQIHHPVAITESTESIEARIKSRFVTLQKLTGAVLNGDIKTLIVSGPAGLGKSFVVEEELTKADPAGDNWEIIKGNARATGLYKALWKHREEGNILVFDDCDAIFSDEVSLNMLKAACDTSKKRRLAWLTETEFEDENGDVIPRSFEFEGSVIFITNYDFDAMIEKGNKLSPHMAALMSRSHYLDLLMKTATDAIVRIRQIVHETDILNGLTNKVKDEILDFVEANASSFRELSLRTVIKIAACYRIDSDDWKSMAKITQCR